MNITQLHKDCKEKGNKCFEDFKHYIENYPSFCLGEVDIEGTIEYTIRKEFGRKAIKRHIEAYTTIEQIKQIDKIVEEYKEKLIEHSKKWCAWYLESK